MKNKLFKDIMHTIKYGIICGDIGFTLHCLLLLNGINLHIFEFVFGISFLGFIVMFLSTYLLNFCNLTRAFLIHGFLVKCCIEYQEHIGFGVLLNPFRYVMLLSGIILIYLLLFKKCV